MIGLVSAKAAAARLFLPSLTVASVAALLLSEAWAGEQVIEPTVSTPTAEATAAASGSLFDVGFGIAFTTDYVSRGVTNSDSRPAIQGYIEPSIGMAYLNIWSSNVDYGEGFEGAEIDVAGGIRPEFGPLSLDVGYVHYFYTPEHVSPDYGELFAKADYDFNDKFTLGGRLFFAPDYNQTGDTATWLAGGIRVPLPHDFSVYGGVGYQFFENPDAFEQFAWTAGVSYSWKALTFDVRYWDTNLSDDECAFRSGFSDGCDARVTATVSFDTSWSEARDWLSKR